MYMLRTVPRAPTKIGASQPAKLQVHRAVPLSSKMPQTLPRRETPRQRGSPSSLAPAGHALGAEMRV